MTLLSHFLPPPLYLIDWLLSQSIITQKLRSYATDVNMQVISHQWSQTNYWERFTLGITDSQLIRRNIITYTGPHACWFARTMIPATTYAHDPAFFDRLQQEPLSALIYHEPRVQRFHMHSYGVSPGMLEYHWVDKVWHESMPCLWGRLSTLRFDQTFFFYLFELFLPGLTRVLESSLPLDAT